MVSAYSPKTLEEALIIRTESEVIPFAGGTDLMVRKKNWSGLPAKFEASVMFIGGVDELKIIESNDKILRIGPAVTLSRLMQDMRIPGILKLAAAQMGSPAIRNMGTIGGNICNASPAGDTLPALYALGASVILQSSKVCRKLPIEKFITGPGKTALKESEILTGIIIPEEDFNVVYYKKVGTRKADALSKLSFAGLAKIVQGRVEDIRLAFGAVAPTAVRLKDVEAVMKNKNTYEIALMAPALSGMYDTFINPINDQRSTAHYRKTVALRLLEYFLRERIDG